MTMVSPAERTIASSRALPSASIRLTNAGVTLSLKCSCTIVGALANMLPSPGSAETSSACADTPVAKQRTDSNVASPAIRRIVRALRFRHQFNTRCRPLTLMPIVSLAFDRHFDPAANALLAFLHRRKIQRAVRLQSIRQEGADDEFVSAMTG